MAETPGRFSGLRWFRSLLRQGRQAARIALAGLPTRQGQSQASFTPSPGPASQVCACAAHQRVHPRTGHTPSHAAVAAAPACAGEDGHGGHPGRCRRPDASNERGTRRRGGRDEAARRLTAAGRRGPHLRGRPRPGTLIDRRGAALAPPILLAAALNVAAVAGLAGLAGFHAVYASLTRIQGPWLGAVPAALATSAVGYCLAYRSIYAAEGGYALPRRQLTAVVAAGFDGLFSTGRIRPDGLVLQASGASRRQALVRLTTLGGMEQGVLAVYGCAASITWLSLGRPGVPLDFTLPWAVIPAPAFAAAFGLASRSRARPQPRAGCPARLSVLLDAVLLIRALFAHPIRHRGAIAGMALFWAGDAAAVWSALAAFGVPMNGAALLVGYCTGTVVTRRIAPLAGAGTLTLILPLTIWASGAPLPTAITGVAACRLLGSWLSLPPALASRPAGRTLAPPDSPAPRAWRAAEGLALFFNMGLDVGGAAADPAARRRHP